MPWKPISKEEARERFVKLLMEARTPMAEACRLCRVSRKTGYKWKRRYLEEGRRGLRDRSRCPKRSPRRTAEPWLRAIRKVRRRHRRWGARKIWAHLGKQYPGQRVPAVRTITLWLERWGLTHRRRRRPPRGPQVLKRPLTEPVRSNQVWTVDFKGWFRTGDGRRVDPLTVKDLFSRYMLAVRLLRDQQWWRVKAVFTGLFQRYGKPEVIRSDNGFGSKGPGGLSRLSAWWTALGIRVEFIDPGQPGQNASHEQMHREYKADQTRPPSSNMRAQQRRTDRWKHIYNWVRPHDMLELGTPGESYRPGRGVRVKKVAVRYPDGWEVRSVRSNGQIRWRGRLRFIGESVVGMKVGLKPVGAGRRRVYLAGVLLGELRAADACGLRPAAYVRKRPFKQTKV